MRKKYAKKSLRKVIYTGLLVAILAVIWVERGSFANHSNKHENAHKQHDQHKTLVVGLSADYPPFEFKTQGELQGYDVDLATELGKELGAKVEFVDMDFSGLIPALKSAKIDMAVSGITDTAERRHNVDFSKKYFAVMLDVISNHEHKLTSASELTGKRVGVQLGSTMEQYAKSIPDASVVALATNHQLIQELKIGRIDAIICEHVQAVEFSKMNPTLVHHSLGLDKVGYAIAFAKGSPLVAEINAALLRLQEHKQLHALQKKWIDSAHTEGEVQGYAEDEVKD